MSGSTSSSTSGYSRAIALVSLIIAAEAIFSLPYHVARYFRPTFLLAFDVTNTQLGLLQSAYGVVAMLAYFPGGPVADLFPARKLITGSLLSTAAGGLYFSTIPNFDELWLLFAFWGLTTILLFWAALIRATREWGDSHRQGRAYGLLDAGRGLLSAVMASVAVALFSLLLPESTESLTQADRVQAIREVILFYTAVTFFAALLTWFFVKEPASSPEQRGGASFSARQMRKVLGLRTVWLQALVVICAYVGFRGIDYLSLFAVEVYGLSEVEAAQISAALTWVRPVAALGAGFLGDRILSSRASGICFIFLAAAYLVSGTDEFSLLGVQIFILNIVVSSAAAFGLRGIYFALLEEGQVPAAVTGSAVGVVSVLGYSPDVFFGVAIGWLLDSHPGASGYQYFSWVMLGFSILGMTASFLFARTTNRAQRSRACLS